VRVDISNGDIQAKMNDSSSFITTDITPTVAVYLGNNSTYVAYLDTGTQLLRFFDYNTLLTSPTYVAFTGLSL
jgi:hypothetical protein